MSRPGASSGPPRVALGAFAVLACVFLLIVVASLASDPDTPRSSIEKGSRRTPPATRLTGTTATERDRAAARRFTLALPPGARTSSWRQTTGEGVALEAGGVYGRVSLLRVRPGESLWELAAYYGADSAGPKLGSAPSLVNRRESRGSLRLLALARVSVDALALVEVLAPRARATQADALLERLCAGFRLSRPE